MNVSKFFGPILHVNECSLNLSAAEILSEVRTADSRQLKIAC